MGKIQETYSRARNLFRNLTRGILIVAGFFFILFAKSPGLFHLPQALGGGVAHADAPSCGVDVSCSGDSGSASGAGCGGGSDGCGGADCGE